MKKSLIALAAFAAVASAQADVTVYGTLDPSIVVNKMTVATGAGVSAGTSTSYGTSSAMDKSSQIGFKGSEAIGGGMKVIFDLQGDLTLGTGSLGSATSGFNNTATSVVGANTPVQSDAGAASVFNRNAYVGLETASGTLKVGRQFTPFHEDQVNNDAMTMNSGGFLAVMSQITNTGAGNFGINTKSMISSFGNQNTGITGYGNYANGLSFETASMNGLVAKVFQTWGNASGVATTTAAQNLPLQSSGITSLKVVYDVNPSLKLNGAYQITRAGQASVPTVGGADVYSDAVYGVAPLTTTTGTAPALSAVTPGQQVFSVNMYGAQYTMGNIRFTVSQAHLQQAIAGFDSVAVTHAGFLYSYKIGRAHV